MFRYLKFEATFKLDIKFKIVAKMCEFMLFITMQTWYMDDTSKIFYTYSLHFQTRIKTTTLFISEDRM